ncbi:MAG: hypothetical protein ABII71_02225 [Candidatus Micrarchaeota archaeon]
MAAFEEFLKEYFKAIEAGDKEFVKKVYSDWLETSGMVPEDKMDFFLSAVFGDLKQMVGAKLVKTENIDDFNVAHYKDENGEFTLSFMKKDGSWVFFNERSNFSLFKRAYAINYNVKGGRLRILFNGKRFPLISDIEDGRNGVITLINCALKPGENEVILQSLDGTSLEVSLQISSGKVGEVMNSAQGDSLDYNGRVKEPVVLKFKAE